MNKFLKKSLTAAAIGALCVASNPVLADADETPSAGAMVADAAIARPAGVVLTALGSVAFVVSLPFSALGGNVKEAADQLVVGPAKNTFVRCLGCTSTKE